MYLVSVHSFIILYALILLCINQSALNDDECIMPDYNIFTIVSYTFKQMYHHESASWKHG